MTAAELSNPILNTPYAAPAEHVELGPDGPTGTVLPGRRPSESFISVPAVRQGKAKAAQGELAEQTTLDFDLTGERREQNSLDNLLKAGVRNGRRHERIELEAIEPYAGAAVLAIGIPGPSRSRGRRPARSPSRSSTTTATKS